MLRYSGLGQLFYSTGLYKDTRKREEHSHKEKEEKK
jgi:hypothetical protein